MSDIEMLREILLDYQELHLPTGVPRRISMISVAGKAAVCIGVRRSGKSTYLHQIISGLQEQGVDRCNILYLNFFDDRLHNLRERGLGEVAEAYFSLYPEKQGREKLYFFFDEVQLVKGWESFVERLMRTEDCEVYITGSSAQMLSREIATQMRGRALSWEMFPFSFREYLDSQGIDAGLPVSTRKRLTIQKAFEGFWESGGFPETAGVDRRLRMKIHQEYWSAMIFRDLVERHDISHPRAVSDMAHRVVDNIASMHSINSLTGYLQSLGHKVPKASVSDYLEWFEDAYVFFTVRIYDASSARRNTNPKKIYCIDHALAVSVGSGVLVNSGHLLENLVFVALRRLTPDIHYYKTSAGRETDFIAILPDGTRRLVQVCESLVDPETRKREVSALSQAMDELRLSQGTIVTRSGDETIEVEAGTIDVVPAWRFLLDLS